MNSRVPATLFFLLQMTVGSVLVDRGYAYQPLSVRLLEADIVLLGTLTEITAEGDSIRGQLKVEKTLKGTPPESDKVTAVWSNNDLEAASSEVSVTQPAIGTRGVWFFCREKNSRPLRGLQPELDVPVAEVAEIEQQLADLRQLEWSEPEGGLKMALVVEVRGSEGNEVWVDGRLVIPKATVAIFPIAENTLDGNLVVGNFSADHPFAAHWSQAGRWAWQAKLYSTPKFESLQARTTDFQQIPPHRIRQIGHGFVLSPLVEEGLYTLNVEFSNNREMSDAKKGSMWKGKIELPSVKLQLPPQK